MNKHVILTISAFWIAISVYAQDAPKYSNDFLSIGVGAAAFGMSNSTVANTNNVSSVYWNPAGLANNPLKYDIGLTHAEYFAGISKYDYVGAAQKLDDC